MARKKTALLMPVGTGVGGTDEATDSLAHGILYSIDTYNPDDVIFFGSELSKKTIESLSRQYRYLRQGRNRKVDNDSQSVSCFCFNVVWKEIIFH